MRGLGKTVFSEILKLWLLSERLKLLFWFRSETETQNWPILSGQYHISKGVTDSMGYSFHHKRAPETKTVNHTTTTTNPLTYVIRALIKSENQQKWKLHSWGSKLKSIEQTYFDTPLYGYYSVRSIVSATKWSGKSQLRKDRAAESIWRWFGRGVTTINIFLL